MYGRLVTEYELARKAHLRLYYKALEKVNEGRAKEKAVTAEFRLAKEKRK